MPPRYEFETDYNDHFETPLVAYEDIAPLLGCVASTTARAVSKAKAKAKAKAKGNAGQRASGSTLIYDPYFCQGRVKRLLGSLGFCNVRNENRDFYVDVENDAVPAYDVLCTNPPYSADHKERLLRFILDNEPKGGHRGAADPAWKPFLLLLPAWVATKAYWRRFVRELALRRGAGGGDGGGDGGDTQAEDAETDEEMERQAGVFYVIPPNRYEFDHPDGTGHDTSPFQGIWFCGGWPGAGAGMDNARRSKGRGWTVANKHGPKSGRSAEFSLERAIGALISAQKVRARTPPHDFAKIARSLAELRKRGYIRSSSGSAVNAEAPHALTMGARSNVGLRAASGTHTKLNDEGDADADATADGSNDGEGSDSDAEAYRLLAQDEDAEHEAGGVSHDTVATSGVSVSPLDALLARQAAAVAAATRPDDDDDAAAELDEWLGSGDAKQGGGAPKSNQKKARKRKAQRAARSKDGKTSRRKKKRQRGQQKQKEKQDDASSSSVVVAKSQLAAFQAAFSWGDE